MTRGSLEISGTHLCVCQSWKIVRTCLSVCLWRRVGQQRCPSILPSLPLPGVVACFWREELPKGNLLAVHSRWSPKQNGNFFTLSRCLLRTPRFHFELKSSGGWDFLPCYSVFPKKNALVWLLPPQRSLLLASESENAA